MKIESGLIYYASKSLHNNFKRILKNPVKLLGLIALVSIILIMPLQLRDIIILLGLNNKHGFVLCITLGNIAFVLPSLKSYLKRKGLAFGKTDINLMFPTPMSSIQILILNILKQTYLSFIFSLVISLMGIFIFDISASTVVLYFLADLFIYNVVLNEVAIIMFADTRTRDSLKNIFPWVLGTVLLVVFGILVNDVIGLPSMSLIVKNFPQNPILFLIPVVGQGIALFQLIILGPTLSNSIASCLMIVAGVYFYFRIISIEDTSDYYEEALSYSQEIAITLEKMKKKSPKKNIRKHVEGDYAFTRKGAWVIPQRQWLEVKRTRKLLIGFWDLCLLFLSVGLGLFSRLEFNDFTNPEFAAGLLGFTLYLLVYFNRKPLWLHEFNNKVFFVLPIDNRKKLFFASMIDYVFSAMRAIFIVLPVSIILNKPIGLIMLLLINTILLLILVGTSKMLFDTYISAKIGEVIASFTEMFFNIIVLGIPIIFVVTMFLSKSYGIGLIVIPIYSSIMTFVILTLTSKVLTDIDSLK